MSKRSFIHGVFGNLFNIDKTPTVLYQEIKLNLSNKYQIDYITYIFGEDNEKYLQDLGVKTILVDKRSWVWDRATELHRHKIEFYKIGMEEFDEIVFLDWDVLQTTPLLNDYWENLYKKEEIQGNIHRSRRGTCPWRSFRIWKNRIMNTGILYLRNKDLPKLFIKNWNEVDGDKFLKMNNDKKFWRWDDEIIIQYVIDNIYGFIDGKKIFADEWKKRFEMDSSVLVSFRGLKKFSKDLNDRVCFNHLLHNFDRLKKYHLKINENYC